MEQQAKIAAANPTIMHTIDPVQAKQFAENSINQQLLLSTMSAMSSGKISPAMAVNLTGMNAVPFTKISAETEYKSTNNWAKSKSSQFFQANNTAPASSVLPRSDIVKNTVN